MSLSQATIQILYLYSMSGMPLSNDWLVVSFIFSKYLPLVASRQIVIFTLKTSKRGILWYDYDLILLGGPILTISTVIVFTNLLFWIFFCNFLTNDSETVTIYNMDTYKKMVFNFKFWIVINNKARQPYLTSVLLYLHVWFLKYLFSWRPNQQHIPLHVYFHLLGLITLSIKSFNINHKSKYNSYPGMSIVWYHSFYKHFLELLTNKLIKQQDIPNQEA